MTWFQVPGLDCDTRPDNQQFANRAVALACAGRLLPLAMPAMRFAQTPTGKAAGEFLAWLRAAKTDWDAYRRRIALAFACDQIQPDITAAQVLAAARSIHTWLGADQPRPVRPA
ncbi:MAG: hypothetical protein ACRDRJ_38320 [Streptosporangiaceae bacterium]